MAKYIVKTKSFINNTLLEEGDEVEYDGEPSGNLEPVDRAAKKAATVATSDAEALARLSAAANTGSPDAPAPVPSAELA